MTNFNFQSPSSIPYQRPYKSVALALILSVILGPVGLLYSSFWGGFLMIVLGIVVVSNKYIFPIILLWLICCILSVYTCEKYNKRLWNSFNQR